MSAARDKVIGSTTHNTGEMRRMGTGKLRISTADVVPVVQENPAALAVPAGLAAQVEQVALAGLAAQVVELELSRVEGLELVQVAVALRTKSVTARPRRGLVPAPRVEVAVAAAEVAEDKGTVDEGN